MINYFLSIEKVNWMGFRQFFSSNVLAQKQTTFECASSLKDHVTCDHEYLTQKHCIPLQDSNPPSDQVKD